MENIFFQDDDDPIDIRIDGAFKAVFAGESQESRGALSNLVSALVGRELTIITILTNEPAISNIRDRQLRLDINCRAENGELVNVEMSFNPKPFEPLSMEFRAAKLFSGQDIRGKDKGFDDLKEVYQITILAKEKVIPDEEFLHSFEYYDAVNKTSLNGRIKIITMELSKLEKTIKKPVEQMERSELWAVYLEYLTDRSKRHIINDIVKREEGIAMASSVLYKVSKDEIERTRIFLEEMAELDRNSEMRYAKEEGHAQGIAEGIAEGLEQGHSKGKQETQKYVLDLIAQGLTVEEIKKQLEG